MITSVNETFNLYYFHVLIHLIQDSSIFFFICPSTKNGTSTESPKTLSDLQTVHLGTFVHVEKIISDVLNQR